MPTAAQQKLDEIRARRGAATPAQQKLAEIRSRGQASGPSREAIFPAAERPKPRDYRAEIASEGAALDEPRKRTGAGVERAIPGGMLMPAKLLGMSPGELYSGAKRIFTGDTAEEKAAGANVAIGEAMKPGLVAMGGVLGRGAAGAYQAGKLLPYGAELAAEIGGGAVAEQVARKGLESAGATPEVAELTANVGTLPVQVVAPLRAAARYAGMRPKAPDVPLPHVTPAPEAPPVAGLLPPAPEPTIDIPTGTPEPIQPTRRVRKLEDTDPRRLIPPSRQLPAATAIRLPGPPEPMARPAEVLETVTGPESASNLQMRTGLSAEAEALRNEGARQLENMRRALGMQQGRYKKAVRALRPDQADEMTLDYGAIDDSRTQMTPSDVRLTERQPGDIVPEAIGAEDILYEYGPAGGPPEIQPTPDVTITGSVPPQSDLPLFRGEPGEVTVTGNAKIDSIVNAINTLESKITRETDPEQLTELQRAVQLIEDRVAELTPEEITFFRNSMDERPEGGLWGTIAGTEQDIPASRTGSYVPSEQARQKAQLEGMGFIGEEAATGIGEPRYGVLRRPAREAEQHAGAVARQIETDMADLRNTAGLAHKTGVGDSVGDAAVGWLRVAQSLGDEAPQSASEFARGDMLRAMARDFEGAGRTQEADEMWKMAGEMDRRARAQFAKENADLLSAKQAMAAKAAGKAAGRPDVSSSPGGPSAADTAAEAADTPFIEAHRENPWALPITVFRSVESRLQRMGEAGTKLAGMYRNVFTEGKREAGKSIEPLLKDGLEKMSAAERVNLGHVLAGEAAPITDRVEITAAEARARLNDVAAKATQLGVEIRPDGGDSKIRSQLAEQDPELFQALENYVPRMVYNPEAYLTNIGSAERAFRPGSITAGKKSAAQELQKEGSSELGKKLRWSPIAQDVMSNMVDQGIVPDALTAERVMSQFVRAQTEQVPNAAHELADLHAVLREFNPQMTAQEMAAKLRQRTRLTDPMMGSLEKHRTLDLSPLADPNMARVLPKYLENAHQRLAEIKYLGQRLENVEQVISSAAKSGAAAPAIDKLIELTNVTLGGVTPSEHNTLVSTLTKAQLMKLGLAFVPNALQTLNALWYTGDAKAYFGAVYDVYLKGIAHWASGGKVDFEAGKLARQSGSTIESALRKLTAADNQTGWLLDKTLWAFTQTENANRMISAMTGFRWADKLEAGLRKGGKEAEWAARELDLMGLDSGRIQQQKALSVDDKLDIAQRVNDITNFSSSALDTPAFLHGESSQFYRMLWQYKTYAYGMGRMMSKRMLHDWKHDKARLAMSAGAVALFYPAAGYAASQLRAMVYDAATGGDTEFEKVSERYGFGDDTDGLAEHLIKFISAGASETAVFGLLNSALESSQYRGMADFMAGPTLSSGFQLAEAAGSENPEFEVLKWAIKGYAPFGAALWRGIEEPTKEVMDYQTKSDKEKRAKARARYQ